MIPVRNENTVGFREELKVVSTPRILSFLSITFSIAFGLIAVVVDLLLLPAVFTVSFISDKNFTFMVLRRVNCFFTEFDKKHKLWDYKYR